MAEFDDVACPECGDVHRHVRDDVLVEAAEIIDDAAVRIADIQAKRDIALARIQAGVYRDEVVVEAAVEGAKAAGALQVVEDLTAPEEAPEPVPPVVIEQDNSVDQEQEDEDREMVPPDSEGSKASRSAGIGMW